MTEEHNARTTHATYRGIVLDWAGRNRRWLVGVLTAAIMYNLFMNGMGLIDRYLIELSPFWGEAFGDIATWMIVFDSAVYLYLALRASALLAGEADSETLIGEFSNHPIWLYLLITMPFGVLAVL